MAWARTFRRKWKKILKKLSKKLKIAIRKNIGTDDIHLQKISWKLDRIYSGIEAKVNTDPQIVIALFSLCFELIAICRIIEVEIMQIKRFILTFKASVP